MKKLITALILFSATTASAGLFSTVSGMTMEEIKPKQAYTIDTAGVNPRIYQWQPLGLPDYMCIAIFSNSETSIPAMQCFKYKRK
jgi:hypothetical protein